MIESELGWVGLMRSTLGICASTLPRQTVLAALTDLNPSSADHEADEEDFCRTAQAVHERLAGRPTELEEPLDLSGGTPFQQAVWRAILAIPLGQTCSYGRIAEAIGRPLAAHAVGQAVGRNPLPLFIPCHRVVAGNGLLGGFGHGHEALPLKRSLLRREGIYYEGPTLEQIRMVAGD